jgi:HSP20 family protein
MNRVFDESLGDVEGGSTRTWGPPVEIFETDEELFLVAELPGLAQKEIDISFDNGLLILSGERKPDEEGGRNYHRNERWYGKFERSFQLPTAYDPDKITAKLLNGILTIRVPKSETAKPRQIPVSSG